MSDPKHVQTELSEAEYHRFKSLADEQGLSLTAALREAIELWMAQQADVDPDDPLFEILEELDDEPAPETPRTNAAEEDDLVEEWSGATSGIRLSDSSTSEE